MARTPRFDRLATERRNRASAALDRMDPVAIANLMNREDARAVRAVGRVRHAIARAVDAIVAALAAGGRLFFVGAGTSGRLGVLEAAECPATFGTPPSLGQAVMAGGPASGFRSRQGARDDPRGRARQPYGRRPATVAEAARARAAPGRRACPRVAPEDAARVDRIRWPRARRDRHRAHGVLAERRRPRGARVRRLARRRAHSSSVTSSPTATGPGAITQQSRAIRPPKSLTIRRSTPRSCSWVSGS